MAAEVQGLYETEVIAKSQSPDDRNLAFKDALSSVLNRVAAGNDIINDQAVRTALSNASYYVKQYQYSLVENRSVFGNGGSEARTMRVLFDEQALLNLINTGNLKIWGESRPETLLWLVVEENGQRLFFKPETMPAVNVAVINSAKQTGLPVLFPLMDLDEQRLLSVNDVLSAYPQNLLAVSEHYGVVSILAGRVVKTHDCWKSDWAFYFDQRIEQWTKSCGTLHDAILIGLQGVYNKLANYYAVKPYVIEMNVVTLKISGILGMDDRNRITHYLKSLKMVKSVNWMNSDAGIDRFKISFEGNKTDLEEMVGLGRVLDPKDTSTHGTNELDYHAVPNRFH
ncbi:MAG: DUF2066 domain-containing protein [Methylococcaceae bacterium]|nr:DUF2066 domain-containing protein [Methylococcaceae bacterium]